jgi:hypothetical protein
LDIKQDYLIRKGIKKVETIITALISGLCVGIPTIISTIVINNKNSALIKYRLEQLELRVKEHNNFGVRFQKIEDDVKYLKERVK